MVFPKFGLFNFPDNNAVKVDSTDIIRCEHRREENMVTSRQQIDSEDGYIEVCLPSRSRKGEAKTLAAKILCLGDNFKDLIEKKTAFLRNEDIWHSNSTTSAVRRTSAESAATQDQNRPKKKRNKGTGRHMLSSDDETDIDAPPAFGTSKPKMMKAANERVLSQLKSSLMNKRPRTSTPSQSEEDDEDIDTNMDLFDSPQASGTADPCFRQQGMESGQVNQALENIHRHQDVMDALKEIPSLVKCVKELTTTMQRLLPSFDSDTSSGSSSPAPEMISLADSAVVVKRKCFKRLNRSRMSLFAQDLALLVFGRDILASSSLTGHGNQKDPLDPEKLNALVDTVMSEFPGTSTSDVRAVIRRKCNNENFFAKKKV